MVEDLSLISEQDKVTWKKLITKWKKNLQY